MKVDLTIEEIVMIKVAAKKCLEMGKKYKEQGNNWSFGDQATHDNLVSSMCKMEAALDRYIMTGET